MKKLFVVNSMDFDSKHNAKIHRDMLISNGVPCHVSIGVDHWRYGLKGNPRTHSHNARSGGPGTGFPRGKR